MPLLPLCLLLRILLFKIPSFPLFSTFQYLFSTVSSFSSPHFPFLYSLRVYVKGFQGTGLSVSSVSPPSWNLHVPFLHTSFSCFRTFQIFFNLFFERMKNMFQLSSPLFSPLSVYFSTSSPSPFSPFPPLHI